MADKGYSEMETFALAEKLNKQSFYGLKSIRLGDALFYTLMSSKDYAGSGWRSLARIAKYSLLNILHVDRQGDGRRIVFLYSNSYRGRMDYMSWFRKVYVKAENRLVFTGGKSFSLGRLRYLTYIFLWLPKFLKIGKFKEALYLVSVLYIYYGDYRQICRILERESVSLLVSLCDVHGIDSLVTQYCKMQGIPTATLEHGYMATKAHFTLPHSDYFLGFGECMRQFALSYGMSDKRFLKVGMPQLLGVELPRKSQLRHEHKLGVICNGGRLIPEDEAMIRIAIEFGQQRSYKVYVKLHPGTGKEFYQSTLLKVVDKVYMSELTAMAFAQGMDFTLVSGSGMFIEYAVRRMPAFLYPSAVDVMYANVTFNKIGSTKELVTGVDRLYADPESFIQQELEVGRYYTEYEDVDGNYQRFLDRFQ